ncbi:MAG: cytochrome P450 [Actinobacteria bacterium]|nr:MAG: cytochrome P450 [Actinomycetota bacterium]
MTLPPGPPYPRAVQTLGWVKRPMPFMERCRERYGDAFTLRIAHEGTWVLLSDPEAVKQVFTGDPRLLHAGEANVVLLPVLGSHSVLLLDEDPHMRQRKLMLPPLHGERLARHAETMREVAEREVAGWPAGEPLTLAPRMQDVTLEVIVRTVFGLEGGERQRELRRRLRAALDLLVAPGPYLLFLILLGPHRAAQMPALHRVLKPVDDLLLEEIARRREDPLLSERDDVLSLLLQARHDDGEPMSDRELRDELMTLLVAGHETTATAVSWAVERLLRHPDKLERARSGDEEYMDAIVKETLRLRPVIPIVARKLMEPMEIGGWELPAGATAAPCIHLIHRREDVYPEPRAFRPERFLEEPAGTYTWIPFGGGVRRCLGAAFALQEMKIVLQAIVAQAPLRPVRPDSERVSRRSIALVPERGAEVMVGAAS